MTPGIKKLAIAHRLANQKQKNCHGKNTFIHMANFSLICHAKIYSMFAMANIIFIHMATSSLLPWQKLFYSCLAKNTFVHMGNFSLIFRGKNAFIHMTTLSLIFHGNNYSISAIAKILLFTWQSLLYFCIFHGKIILLFTWQKQQRNTFIHMILVKFSMAKFTLFFPGKKILLFTWQILV